MEENIFYYGWVCVVHSSFSVLVPHCCVLCLRLIFVHLFLYTHFHSSFSSVEALFEFSRILLKNYHILLLFAIYDEGRFLFQNSTITTQHLGFVMKIVVSLRGRKFVEKSQLETFRQAQSDQQQFLFRWKRNWKHSRLCSSQKSTTTMTICIFFTSAITINSMTTQQKCRKKNSALEQCVLWWRRKMERSVM